VTTPAQEFVFLASLKAAAAIRETARAQALANFDPSNPTNFVNYVAATSAADATFRATVAAAAAAADITLTPPGASS
jgi:hypothetical protein